MTKKLNAERWEAYILMFGAVVGFCCYKSSPVWLWLSMGLFGGVLLELENRRLPGRKTLNRLRLMDGTAALLLVLLWGVLLPDFLGLVKQLLMAIPLTVYVLYILRRWIPIHNE